MNNLGKLNGGGGGEMLVRRVGESGEGRGRGEVPFRVTESDISVKHSIGMLL